MAAKPPTIQQRWDELQCDVSVKRLPQDLRSLCDWVRTVAGCLGGQASANDQLGFDASKYILEEYFRPLQGGQLMDALGTNNDCLVHSFLSCVCADFRKYTKPIRSTIASFFRRFIMIQLGDANQNRLQSGSFLETEELSLLCIHFKIQFIIVKRGFYPVDRHVEIIPVDDVVYNWRNQQNESRGPFYVIHGSGAHFTPVAWNNTYKLEDKSLGQLKNLEQIINREARDDLAPDEVRKAETEHAIGEFLDRYDLNATRQLIRTVKTQVEKDEIVGRFAVPLGQQLNQYINRLDKKKYRRDYAGRIAFDRIISVLTGGVDNAASAQAAQAASSKTSKKNIPSFEPDDDLSAVLEESRRTQEEREKANAANAAQMNAAIKASLNDSLSTEQQVAQQEEQDLRDAIMMSLQQGVAKSEQPNAQPNASGNQQSNGQSNVNEKPNAQPNAPVKPPNGQPNVNVKVNAQSNELLNANLSAQPGALGNQQPKVNVKLNAQSNESLKVNAQPNGQPKLNAKLNAQPNGQLKVNAQLQNNRKPIKKSAFSANDVLRRVSNITATIAGIPTNYTATVYKPTVNGGKRRTHKKIQKKNRKTRRHIKK